MAKANLGKGLTGTWKEEGNAAVISRNTGRVTKIAKEGDHYKKTAYKKGYDNCTAGLLPATEVPGNDPNGPLLAFSTPSWKDARLPAPPEADHG